MAAVVLGRGASAAAGVTSQSDDEIVNHLKKTRGRGRGVRRQVQSTHNSPSFNRPGNRRSYVSSPGGAAVQSNVSSPGGIVELTKLPREGIVESIVLPPEGAVDCTVLPPESAVDCTIGLLPPGVTSVKKSVDSDTTMDSDKDTGTCDSDTAAAAAATDVGDISTTESDTSTTTNAKRRGLYDIIVTRVIDPHNIWAQFGRDGSLKHFRQMDDSINDYCSQSHLTIPNMDAIRIHQLVFAFSSITQKWHRASVIRVDSEVEEIDVYFIDYGNNEVVNVDEIRTPIPEVYSVQPGLAYMCRLNGVQPLASVWIRRATEQFRSLVLNKTAQASYCMKDNTIYVNIFVTINDEKVSVAQCLIDDELAMPSEDTELVTIDNEETGSDDKQSEQALSSPWKQQLKIFKASSIGLAQFKIDQIPKNMPSSSSSSSNSNNNNQDHDHTTDTGNEISLEAQILFGDILTDQKDLAEETTHHNDQRSLIDKIEEQIQHAQLGFQDKRRKRNLSPEEKAPVREENEMIKTLRKKFRHLSEIEIPRLFRQEIFYIENTITENGLDIEDIFNERDVKNLVPMIIKRGLSHYDTHCISTIRLLKLIHTHKQCKEMIGATIIDLTHQYVKVSKQKFHQERVHNFVKFMGVLFVNSATWESEMPIACHIHDSIKQIILKWSLFKKSQSDVCAVTELYLNSLVQILYETHHVFKLMFHNDFEFIQNEIKTRILDGHIVRSLRSALLDLLLDISSNKSGVSFEDKSVQCNDAVTDLEDDSFADNLSSEIQPDFELVYDILSKLNLTSLYPKFIKWGLDDGIVRSDKYDLETLLPNCGFSYIQTSNIIRYIITNKLRRYVTATTSSRPCILSDDSDAEQLLLRGIGQVLSSDVNPADGVVTRVDRSPTSVMNVDNNEFPPLVTVDVNPYGGNRDDSDDDGASSPPSSPASSLLQNQFDVDYQDASLSVVCPDTANKLYSEMTKLNTRRNDSRRSHWDSRDTQHDSRRSHKTDISGMNLISNLVSDENQNRIYDQNRAAVAPPTVIQSTAQPPSGASGTTTVLTLHDISNRLIQSSPAVEGAVASAAAAVGRRPSEDDSEADWWDAKQSPVKRRIDKTSVKSLVSDWLAEKPRLEAARKRRTKWQKFTAGTTRLYLCQKLYLHAIIIISQTWLSHHLDESPHRLSCP
ncbi:uncharacterized protein LOC141898581 isoform X2 [Tubulanus polymorphus]|uniref:uncharacterized protein LOC141898581 isoform X2 n=1 Tax=Tubulanus polymorphus TaxID=672921 RepID=UPI003DA36EF4